MITWHTSGKLLLITTLHKMVQLPHPQNTTVKLIMVKFYSMAIIGSNISMAYNIMWYCAIVKLPQFLKFGILTDHTTVQIISQ